MDDAKYRRLAVVFHENDIEKLKKMLVYQPWVFQVTPELNEQYLFAEQDFSSTYLANGEDGRSYVHPGLMLNQSLVTRSPNFYALAKMAGVHSADEVEWVRPPEVGKTFTVNWEVSDQYEKRGKVFNIVTATVTDEDNNVIMRRKIHGLMMEG